MLEPDDVKKWFFKWKGRIERAIQKIKQFYASHIRSHILPLYLNLGWLLQTVSFLLVWHSCLSDVWSFDRNNYFDRLTFGPWKFTGTAATSVAFDAGVDLTSSYLSYCGGYENAVAWSTTWCGAKTALSATCFSMAILCSLLSYICTFYSITDRKFPTWDGVGRNCSLAFSISFLFAQIVLCIVGSGFWTMVHNEMNGLCTIQATSVSTTCVDVGSAAYYMGLNVVLSILALWYLRVTHRFQVSKVSGELNDSFILYAKQDDVDEVLASIVTGVEINHYGSDGRNALHWACALNRSTSCHILIKKGADIHKKDKEGWTALHWASRMGHSDIVRLLCKYGAQLNVRDVWGTTPLMLSIIGGSKLATNVLIEQGSDVNASNVFGQTSLMMCAEEGHTRRAMAILLTHAGAKLDLVDNQNSNAIHYTSGAGDKYMLETMLDCSSPLLFKKPNKFGATPRDEAVMVNSSAVVHALLRHEYGSDVELEDDESESEASIQDIGSSSESDFTESDENESSSSESD